MYTFLKSPKCKFAYHRMYIVCTYSNYFYKYVCWYSIVLANQKHTMNWKMIDYQVCWYAKIVCCHDTAVTAVYILHEYV